MVIVRKITAITGLYLSLALLLVACGSIPRLPIPSGSSTKAPAEVPIAAPIAQPAPVEKQGVQDFIGADPAILETRIGEPSFTRREGDNRFHRYDLRMCRLYAIIRRGGDGALQISHIETRASDLVEVPPSFSDCLDTYNNIQR